MNRVADWHDLAPVDVLDRYEVLDLEQVAYVLRLVHTRGSTKGQPDVTKVRRLIASGKLRLLDPTQTPRHQTITASVVRYYRDTGDVLPARVPVTTGHLRGVS